MTGRHHLIRFDVEWDGLAFSREMVADLLQRSIRQLIHDADVSLVYSSDDDPNYVEPNR